MIRRKDLMLEYWGPDRLPPQWKTIEEISETTGLDIEYLEEAFDGYCIQRRTPEVEAHKIVWSVLVDIFSLTPQTHFLYQTELNHAPIDFYVIQESIGIIVDPILPYWESKTIHVGNSMIVRLGCTKPEEIPERLERHLRYIGLRPKYMQIDEEEKDGGW